MTSKLELTRTIDQIIVDYFEHLKEDLVNLNTWTATTHLAECIANVIAAPEDKGYETPEDSSIRQVLKRLDRQDDALVAIGQKLSYDLGVRLQGILGDNT